MNYQNNSKQKNQGMLNMNTMGFAAIGMVLLTTVSSSKVDHITPNDVGITLKTYTNMALAGKPATTSILNTTSFSLKAGQTPFSAEMVGTVAFPPQGSVYHFDCSWTASTMGYVWVDGHMVCQDGNTYKPDNSSIDNPLPVNYLKRTKGIVSTLPFRAHFYFNGMPKTPSETAGVSVTWAPISPTEYEAHLVTTRNVVNTTIAEQQLYQTWAELSHVEIPTASLGPSLPAVEQQREELQRSLAQGWGPWLHSNMLPIVKLPDASVITPALCSISMNTCIDSCVPDGAFPHPAPRSHQGVETRVGHHAFDRSYVQFFFAGGATPHGGLNISIEYSVGGVDNSDIDLLVTPVNCMADVINCSDWTVQLFGRYAWLKTGVTTATAGRAGIGSLDFQSPGLDPVSIFSTASALANNADTVSITVSLNDGPVGFSTTKDATVITIATKLEQAKAAEEMLLIQTFGAAKASQGQAVKASAMWTLISTPAENGGAPLMPVSRVWDFTPSPVNSDFTYAIFDWDNLFATLLAASGSPNSTTTEPKGPWGGFEIAISNLFQCIKSKTASGFVPNYAAGGLRSQDRTEPPIGAKVLLELVKKFGKARMSWVVDALVDDILDWSDWFIRKRLLPPLNMVALGTYNDQNHQAGNMQDARYESGLDNSPMYDGTFVNTTNGCSLYESGCGLMQLYDVGMTSMFVQEAFALAELVLVAGRPQSLSDMLTLRATDMQKKISDNLWDENLGIFVNKFSGADHNESFYEHVSPTSFYALQAHAATDAQAAMMATNWMMNSSRFCVAPNGDYAGLTDTCYWGLPSVEASDPAYPPLGYWRGYIWGPMAQLTFWSLQNYDHVPEIRTARKALTKQMAGLMMSQWNENRHICENYNPHKTADTTGGDCSGTRFYHWGALTGLIDLMEEGLF